MIVSWNWLKEYVPLEMSADDLTDKLTLSGLNLEGTEAFPEDLGIDLEVTSNRPDCLGHLGVAREIAALYDKPITIPDAQPSESAAKTAEATSVEIECDDLCPQYIARVVRGVKVAESPDWLKSRLETLGIRPINNIVDISNYVLMECGQPLHTFDMDKLHEGRIVVRRAQPGEKLTAIDQRDYELQPEMCIIADADRPVAIAGVMGGLETEISAATTNVLIEVADFRPLSIRNTARVLNLHSDSSYRFERGVDPHGMDWASRRCAELILELAGGELLEGAVVTGAGRTPNSDPVELRFSQISRILGIDVEPNEVVRILTDLGLELQGEASAASCRFVPPSWRRDLTREIDLIEEVARIYGYEQIPEDVLVPLTASSKRVFDHVADRVHNALNGNGYFESITMTFVDDDLLALFRPTGEGEPLRVEHSSRKRENILRQSLIPSLLQSRRENEKRGTFNARLYEISNVYLAASPGDRSGEPTRLSLVSGDSFFDVKGIVELLAKAVNHQSLVEVRPCELPSFAAGRGCEVLLNGQLWGWLGEIAADIKDKLNLRDDVTVAELDFGMLDRTADLTPQFVPTPQYPSSDRDLNFILDDATTWQQVAQTVKAAAGPLLEDLRFDSQFRGKQIPTGKKSYLLTARYRAADRTLTAEEVDASQQAVIAACREQLGAELRG
ncbi:Phenylalanine--tRNA ligase beta subunit [Symmachiella dynata]|uniref:Phenylalanine--tRNA ligase beta subunit n=1 Tax=Symmachiella dynata TaxID=2527995 RepID=A0A517ZT35_9PLAN|nr:phenylalanine--tRNA ligase subunit beta [Symmachiella dynata]QDU45639.1 Phenylalanine--tRNA ligase beta subunit [Symmachiella dynata]